MQAKETKEAELAQPTAKQNKSKTKMRSYFDKVDSKYKHYTHAKYVFAGMVVFCVVAFVIEIAILGFP
jgi:hypothetical protein